MANGFQEILNCSLVPSIKSAQLNNALDNFITIGYIICIISWLIMNVVAWKTKQVFWVWIPFLLVLIIYYLMAYFDDVIFVFNKQNDFWKGGFSVSYFLSICIVLVGLIVTEINYFVIKIYIIKKII